MPLLSFRSESFLKEALNKSHRGRCGKKWPRARRLGTSIPAAGCKCQAYTAPGRLSSQPTGLKPFVDFCGVARSGETAAGIAQHSRLQKSANALQRPTWDLISASLILPTIAFRLSPFSFDGTCLCLSISRCLDAASLPGSYGHPSGSNRVAVFYLPVFPDQASLVLWDSGLRGPSVAND